jgi:long-subunit acyl-CoA synthetase (AMP-forming)
MSRNTQIDNALHWEKEKPDDLWLTQPMGDGTVKELTWKQALDQARRMAAHLRSLDLPEKSHIAIFSKNSAWWVLSDLAIWMAGHVSIPLYPNLTAETIEAILEHSEAKLIFVGKLDGFKAMEPGIPEGLQRITLPLSPKTNDPKWDDIIAKTDPIADPHIPKPSELSTIIYTSGSTGMPKGAMHSFETMSRSAKALVEMLGIHDGDRMLSYLPLAHSFERWIVETSGLIAGFQIFFAESLNTFVQDLQRARPTLFISVPRLWLKFQQGVFKKMPPKKLNMLLKIPIVNRIIRKKVLTNLGLDQVRFAGCGSAPIPAELIGWYRSLGLELLEGYGMTENFIHSHVSRPGRVRVGYVGEPLPGVECKISEEGEILVKSLGTMLGYYKASEESADCMTEDGFLKTGDRGEIDEKNRLRITGRVKELFKTSKGKYVAPAPIENRLLLHENVEMACVFGSGQSSPFGIVVLSEEARARAKDKATREEISQSFEDHLSKINQELDHHERMGFLVVVAEEWTPENGMLTPTLKLKRAKIEDKFGNKVDGWYGAKKKILWAE